MLTFEELLALWNDEATRPDMTAEQLEALTEHLQEHARELLEGERSDEVLEQLEQVATTVEAIAARVVEVEAEAAATEQRAADLAARILGSSDDDGDDGETTDDDVEGDDTETPTEDETPAEVVDDPDAVVEDAPDTTEAIAAAATRPLRVTRVAARRPESSRPRTPATTPSSLVASANIGGHVQAGSVIETPEDLSAAFIAAFGAAEGSQSPVPKISVARSGHPTSALSLYGEERYLDDNPRANTRKIEAVTSPQAIVAAGGRCVQSPVSYDLPIIQGTEARPVRDDMLVKFGADRGGVVTYPPPVLTDLTSAISDWSADNDEDPGSDGPATKPCLTMTCPEPDEDVVGAIVKCIRIGNFRSRFFGEQVQAWLDLAAVWQARHAERRLLTAIANTSTHVSAGQQLGTARDVLTALDRLVPQFESRHRTGDGVRLHWAAPFWLRDQMRVDIARQMPVGTVDETLAYADSQIDALFAVRGLNVTWFIDGETGQEFGAQGTGPINGWPSTVVSYLYPEGVHQFLDGGMFDFGIMRDTATTATNDFQVFAETLEGHHFHGVESFRISHDVCPDGSASALVDITPCATGS